MEFIKMLHGCRRGEDLAFQEIDFRYRDWIIGLLLARGISHSDANDVCQDVYIAVFLK